MRMCKHCKALFKESDDIEFCSPKCREDHQWCKDWNSLNIGDYINIMKKFTEDIDGYWELKAISDTGIVTVGYKGQKIKITKTFKKENYEFQRVHPNCID